MANSKKSLPLINSHTHIFTGKHVPPFLAKTFVWFPFYYLLHTPTILKAFRGYYQIKNNYYRYPIFKNFERFRNWLSQLKFLTPFRYIINTVLTVQVFFYIYNHIKQWLFPAREFGSYLETIGENLQKNNLLFSFENSGLNIIIVILFFLFFKSGRNLILFVLKKVFKVFGLLPGRMTKDLFSRYILMGRFAIYKEQKRILTRLVRQYPSKSLFVILPMDMEFMGAGKMRNKSTYTAQMEELAAIQTNRNFILPFIFVDPRRMEQGTITNNKEKFFDYSIKEERGLNRVVLSETTFIKKYIEYEKFCGFKIYPALGYYPFDERLLPLWKYAADNNIPIMTHCIKGTIFYRGAKKKSWNTHKIFKEGSEKRGFKPLLLPQRKNKDFTLNFTHPLNYLCLLEEIFLRELISQSEDDKLKKLFGFLDINTPLKSNLNNLKICFGHFGGEDQWDKYFEGDRNNYVQQIIKEPNIGIDFMNNKGQVFSHDKLSQIWESADWYSIICSLMLQYENVFADVSYILHESKIQALLKETLDHEILGKRVVFGTDFYVVRNHNSDKELKASIASILTDEEFDRIARKNPKDYLQWRNTYEQLAAFS